MKKYKYEFSRLITILIIVGIVLCAAGFVANVYQVIHTYTVKGSASGYNIIQYIVMFLVTIVLGAILVSFLCSSYYAIDKESFISCFGFIKSKYKISDVDTLILDRKTMKLSVNFKSEQYIVVCVRQQWYDDFVDEMLKRNPKIEYTIISETNTPDDKVI